MHDFTLKKIPFVYVHIHLAAIFSKQTETFTRDSLMTVTWYSNFLIVQNVAATCCSVFNSFLPIYIFLEYFIELLNAMFTFQHTSLAKS